MLSVLSNWFWMLLAPPFCSWCRTYLDARYPLCQPCLDTIKPVASQTLSCAGYEVIIHALGFYKDPLKKLILLKNYGNPTGSHQLGVLLATQSRLTGDVIIPVPTHWSRSMWRGFNHITIMAEVVAHQWKIPLVHAITRNKRTRMQSVLNVEQRTQNVKGTFSIENGSVLKDKNIILIDDLMTTGSTVRECVKALAHHHPQSIQVMVVCRAL